MSTLSREAKAIVRAGKLELMANNDDRSRITARLGSRLGVAGLVLSSPLKAAPIGGIIKGWMVLTVAGTLGAVGVLVSGAYTHQRGEHATTQSAATLSKQPPLRKELQTVGIPLPLHAPSAQVSDAATSDSVKLEPASRAAKSSRASLGEEVEILSRAEKDLHNGRPALALMALDEHQRRFPSGALVQERVAARIQALCALGRTEAATAESLRLRRTSPNSPQAAHAAKPCESLH